MEEFGVSVILQIWTWKCTERQRVHSGDIIDVAYLRGMGAVGADGDRAAFLLPEKPFLELL